MKLAVVYLGIRRKSDEQDAINWQNNNDWQNGMRPDKS